MGTPSFVLVEPTGRTETCRFVHVPWDLKPDLKANWGTPAASQHLPSITARRPLCTARLASPSPEPLQPPLATYLLLHISPSSSSSLTPRHRLKHEVAKKAQRIPVTRCCLPSHTNHLKSHRCYSTPGGLCRRDLLGPAEGTPVEQSQEAKAPHSSAARDYLGLHVPSQPPISTYSCDAAR